MFLSVCGCGVAITTGAKVLHEVLHEVSMSESLSLSQSTGRLRGQITVLSLYADRLCSMFL